MKQEFEMTQQEMDDIIAINKDHPPVMKIGDNWSGLDLREKINKYWEILGDKYGFKSLTVERSSRGKLFFLAESKPIVVPKTKEEIEIDRYIDDTCKPLKKIAEQLKSCKYKCKGGNLENSIAFKALERLTTK